jgi:organic radical activating enzyme
MEWQAIALAIKELGCDTLVLSGGEPLIHQTNQDLRSLLSGLGMTIHVETNGTLKPERWLNTRVAHWSVSPKLANGSDPQHRRIRRVALDWFATAAREGRCVFKFVAVNPSDLAEVADLVNGHHIPASAVWIMPEGTDAVTLLDRARLLEPYVLAEGWNLTLRQQILLHGDRRLT